MPLNGFEQTIPVGRGFQPTQTPRSSTVIAFDDPSQDALQDRRPPPSTRPAARLVISQTPPRSVVQHRQDLPLMDQFDGPHGAYSDQTGTQRAGSLPRKSTTNPSTNGKAGSSGGAILRGVTSQEMKLPVNNNLPTNRGATPLKHQTSQTTDDSARESDWGSMAGNQGQARGDQHYVAFISTDRRRDSFASSHSNESTTFEPAGYRNMGTVQSTYEQPEQTAILHCASQPKRDLPRRRGVGLGLNSTASALQQQTPAAVKPQRSLGFNLQKDPEVDHQIPDDNSTSLFQNEDKETMQPWDRHRLHDETPSKAASKHTGTTTTVSHKDHGRRQLPVKADRESSPLEMEEQSRISQIQGDPDLPALQAYAKTRRDEYWAGQQHNQASDHIAPTTSTNVAAKVPESSEVSEDDHAPVSTKRKPSNSKRAFDQIDYEEDQLRSMRYAELDELSFLEDPRDYPQPGLSQTGASITLEEKLSKLSHMKHEDQKTLFRSLTDAENEQVGQWFVEKFDNDLKQLMGKRLERRKVALKFELEAKKRQKAVETKQADIETELKELRQGGGNLLQGRAASPRPAAGAEGKS